MKSIEASLVLYILQNEQTCGRTEGKAKHIEERKRLVLLKIAKSGFEVVDNHEAQFLSEEH